MAKVKLTVTIVRSKMKGKTGYTEQRVLQQKGVKLKKIDTSCTYKLTAPDGASFLITYGSPHYPDFTIVS